MTALQYLAALQDLLRRIVEEQIDQIEAAADLWANALANGGMVHVFGSGHSSIVCQDVYGRAGGLIQVNWIVADDLLPIRGMRSSAIERLSGLAAALLDAEPVRAGDALVVVSNSGRNAVPVEMAELAVARGVRTIAVTSLQHSRAFASRAPSGKRLFEVAEIVLDNLAVAGDAAVAVGPPESAVRVGATSTVTGAALLQAVAVEATTRLAAMGIAPRRLRERERRRRGCSSRRGAPRAHRARAIADGGRCQPGARDRRSERLRTGLRALVAVEWRPWLGTSASAQDRQVLRELGQRIGEISALPEQLETRAVWVALNGLRPERPMVAIDQLPWHELADGEPELATRCTDPFVRGYEIGFLRTLYAWKHMRADMVVDAEVLVPKVIRAEGGFGISHAAGDCGGRPAERHRRAPVHRPAGDRGSRPADPAPGRSPTTRRPRAAGGDRARGLRRRAPGPAPGVGPREHAVARARRAARDEAPRQPLAGGHPPRGLQRVGRHRGMAQRRCHPAGPRGPARAHAPDHLPVHGRLPRRARRHGGAGLARLRAAGDPLHAVLHGRAPPSGLRPRARPRRRTSGRWGWRRSSRPCPRRCSRSSRSTTRCGGSRGSGSGTTAAAMCSTAASTSSG